MTKTFLRCGAAGSCLAVAMAMPSVAYAQDEAPASASTDVSSNVIIVTARKREENILEVPASLVVLNSEELDRQGIQDFEDLAFAVPNVYITENDNIAGRTGVTIRGIPGRAGIYVDDVFVGDNSGINTLLVDIETVQVLRGPQGTLFGRNAMSGAINTITKKPNDRAFSGTVDLQVGEYGLFVGRGALNAPITEGVSAKISGGYRARDTFSEDAVRGRLKAEDSYIVQGQLHFEPSDRLDIILSVDYLDESNENEGREVIQDFGFAGQVYGVAAIDGNPNDRIFPTQNVINRADRESINAWGRIDADIGFATLTSITNYREIDFLFVRDADSGGYDYLRGVQPVDYEQFSQELRLTSTSGGPFEWMVGAYYFDSTRSSEDANTIGGDAFIAQNDLFAPAIPAFYPGGIAGVVTPNTLLANPFLAGFDPQLALVLAGLQAQGSSDVGTTTTFDESGIESLAFWASGTLELTDSLEVTAGIRYTDETLTGLYGQDVTGLLPAFGVPVVPLTVLPDRSDDNISINGSISYFISPDATIYASYSEGFRSGGYNLSPGPATADERAFASETVRSYETGLKTLFLNGRAGLNLAAFYSKYSDFQRAFLRATPTGFVNETFNTDATIYGLEADAFVNVNDVFSFTASYGYQDATYDDYENAPVNTLDGLQVVDLTGTDLPFVPKHSFALGGRFQQPVSGNWDMRVTNDVQFRSGYNINDGALDPGTRIGSTILVNPSIGFVNEDIGLQFIFRVNNALNEEYTTGLDFNTFDGAVTRSISAPRVFSFQARLDF